MDRKALCCCLTLLLLAGCGGGKHSLTVGSKNFTEQLILGEITAQLLEHKLGEPVDRKLNLGGTLLTQQALLSGEIDVYPEYTGTAFTNVLKHKPISDAGVVLERVRAEYAAMKLAWLDPLGFDNTFAMVVRGEDARDRHLKTLSDAAADPKGFVLGSGYEFMERPDGYATLNTAYSIHWLQPPKSMDLGLLYTALKQKQVSMAAGSATDGVIAAWDLTILRDDRHAFPPYQACLVTRDEALAAHPKLRSTLALLAGKISEDEMRRMNYEVAGKHRSVNEVASEFLKARSPPL